MNNKRNIYWLIAGIINLFTAILHTIAGQLDLVYPLAKSNLMAQAKAEWIGVWHMVTIILFFTSFLVIKNAIREIKNRQTEIIKYIGFLYIAFSIPFIISSIANNLLAPQWILLLPIGGLIYFGGKTHKVLTNN